MTNYNFNNCSAYRSTRIDTTLESIPQNAVFNSWENETIIYDAQRRVNYDNVMFSIRQGLLNDFDLKVLALIATFGSVCTTSKALSTLLKMHGEDLGSQDLRLTNSLYRLGINSLISFARFKCENKSTASSIRVICLTGCGSKVAKSLGVKHRFNPLEVLDAPRAKSRAQTSMIITNFIQHLPDKIESFECRPIISRKDKHPDAIVRPACKMVMFGQDVYFEVPRHGKSDWLEDLMDKLHRYTLVFGEDLPNIVINGETENMCRTISTHLKATRHVHGYDTDNILYTHDLAQFGESFKTCLYTFDSNGDKICMEFASPDQTAA